MRTMAQLAVTGLDVVAADGVVRVRDGEDTWLATESAWDEAVASLETREAPEDVDAGEAYSLLCRKVRRDSPVASINGSSSKDIPLLVQRAYAADLIDADDVKAYGCEV